MRELCFAGSRETDAHPGGAGQGRAPEPHKNRGPPSLIPKRPPCIHATPQRLSLSRDDERGLAHSTDLWVDPGCPAPPRGTLSRCLTCAFSRGSPRSKAASLGSEAACLWPLNLPTTVFAPDCETEMTSPCWRGEMRQPAFSEPACPQPHDLPAGVTRH